jgi:hypothetical protein
MNYFTKSSQEVNKVYKTNDLSIFKQIKGNRPPNPQHIRRLRESIREYGILQNPIIVNDDMVVIDGQHRLLAAKEAESSVYYIIVKGYNLDEVHILNLNQKNWNRKDFLDGFAVMGIESYIKLKKFTEVNKDFSLNDSIALCSNGSGNGNFGMNAKFRNTNIPKKGFNDIKEVFEEGTWIGKDFNIAQEFADKIRMIKPYYKGYNRSSFVSTMVGLLKNKNFDFFEFLHKLKIQPSKLVDCTNVTQYKMLIEDIYNYRSRTKVNLRY